MSHELRESLVYDYNYNLFLVKTMLPHVRNIEDRQIVIRWLRFLKQSAKTIDELRLRNDFMYYLVLQVREDCLQSPFDKPPSNTPLMMMTSLLPVHGTETLQTDGSQSGIHLPKAGKKSQLLDRSPDGGEFLLSQPIPDLGAFCYMAVVSKKKNNQST